MFPAEIWLIIISFFLKNNNKSNLFKIIPINKHSNFIIRNFHKEIECIYESSSKNRDVF